MPHAADPEDGDDLTRAATLRASRGFILVGACGLLGLALGLVLLAPGMLRPGGAPVVLLVGLLAVPVGLLAVHRQNRTARPQPWWCVWVLVAMTVAPACIADGPFRQSAVLAMVVGPMYAAMFAGVRVILAQIAAAVVCGGAVVAATPGLPQERVLRTAAVVLLLAVVSLGMVFLRRRLDAAVRHVQGARERADHLADHDPLTGLLNRRGLQSRLARCADPGTVSAVLLDVDHFKDVNDRLGHAAGDEVLVRVAATLAATVRAGDLLARVGGEEFLVVTTGPAADGAPELAERLRAAVEADESDPRVTVSAGVAVQPAAPDLPDLLDRLNATADEMLYRAKRGGRNRVVVQPRFGPPGVRV